MSVAFPGVVIPLCLIVLAGTHVSGGEAVPDILNGLINQSILLSLADDDSSRSVQQVIWNFKTNPLITYLNNQITYTEDLFEGRLEILDNGRVMKIGYLRLEDSGLYTATITFNDKTKDRKLYNLTVYEPVLTPNITITDRKKTNDWCNATLICSTPTNKSSLSYTWKYRQRNSTFELYNKSRGIIQITLTNNSWDSEFMCIVHNPADQKNISVWNTCSDKKEGESVPKGTRKRSTYGLLGLLALILPLAFLGCYFIMKRKQRKAGTPDVTENKNREPQYIQVTAFHPNDDRQEWTNSLYDSSPQQKPKAVTVYATLEQPPKTNR